MENIIICILPDVEIKFRDTNYSAQGHSGEWQSWALIQGQDSYDLLTIPCWTSQQDIVRALTSFQGNECQRRELSCILPAKSWRLKQGRKLVGGVSGGRGDCKAETLGDCSCVSTCGRIRMLGGRSSRRKIASLQCRWEHFGGWKFPLMLMFSGWH